MAVDWKLDGMYFEACNCDAACPCVFLSAPTTGECTVIIGWHIEDGTFAGWTVTDRIPVYPYGRYPWQFKYDPSDHDDGENARQPRSKSRTGSGSQFSGSAIEL